MIGTPEVILILVIALIVFGPKRLPEIGRTIGKSLREFRRASQDLRDEFRFSLDDDVPAGPSPAPSPELNGDAAETTPITKPRAKPRAKAKATTAKRPAPKRQVVKRSAPTSASSKGVASKPSGPKRSG